MIQESIEYSFEAFCIMAVLRYSAPFGWMAVSGLALLLGVVLSYVSWKRSAYSKRVFMLEILRISCLLGIALLLLKPEWLRVTRPPKVPEILLLWDDSSSMKTKDVLVREIEKKGEASPLSSEVISRLEATQRLLESGSLKELSSQKEETSKKRRVFVKAFSEYDANQTKKNQGTQLDKVLKTALKKHPNLRSIILLSDGDSNQGPSPVSAAELLRARGVPIYSIPIGSQSYLPDLVLEKIKAPTYGIVGEKVQIPFQVNSSLDYAVNTIVKISSKEGKTETKEITIPAQGHYQDTFVWTLGHSGSTVLTVSIPLHAEETIKTNNEQTVEIVGRKESIRALVIDTIPRWEYRFIRNALSRDPGVKVDCLLFHPQEGMGDGANYLKTFPEKREELQNYDIIFLGDIGIGAGQLSKKQADLLAELVKNQASGLVFIPGPQGNQWSLRETKLGALIPVILDPLNVQGKGAEVSDSLELTREGKESLLTLLGEDEESNQLIWSSLPGFYWHAPVLRAKAGARVLAVHAHQENEYGRLPLLVSSRFGSGKVLYMGIDSAWRWRRGVEDLYHYRFWRQVARWMSYQRHMVEGSSIRLYYHPERPKIGDLLLIRAHGFDPEGNPLKEDALSLEVKAPNGEDQYVQLEQVTKEWGSFQGRFLIDQAGEWSLQASVTSSQREPSLETKFLVPEQIIERQGVPARPDILQDLSLISQGALVNPLSLDELVTIINDLPKQVKQLEVISLWSHWVSIGLLILLLALFWIARTFNGLI